MCAACTFLPFPVEGASREILELLGDSMLGEYGEREVGESVVPSVGRTFEEVRRCMVKYWAAWAVES